MAGMFREKLIGIIQNENCFLFFSIALFINESGHDM